MIHPVTNLHPHVLQIQRTACGGLSMFGPTWSPCNLYVPFYDATHPSTLCVLNTGLETVMTFRSTQCADLHEPHRRWHRVKFDLQTLCVWSPDSTLVASAGTKILRRVDLCWHPSRLHTGNHAAAAPVNALITAASAAGEKLHSLAWSSCGGLAAVTFTEGCEHGECLLRPIHCTLYVLFPGQQMARMRVACRHASVTWSPAGDRLLVDRNLLVDQDRGDDVELVTSRCTSVQHYAKCRASFSPCGRYLAVNSCKDDKVDSSICRTLDGSQVFSFASCSTRYKAVSFNSYGDVLILAGPHDICAVYFKCHGHSSSAYSQQLCSSAAAACRSAKRLVHSCCCSHW